MRRKVAIAGLICLAVAIAAWLAWHGLSSTKESAASLSTGSDEHSHATHQPEGTPYAISAESNDVRLIVNPGITSSAERLQKVHALPDNLSATDREAITSFLKYGSNSDIELVIKNDLMNKLRNQKELPPELTKVLLELYSDRGQNITVRIYALQHLRPQYELTRDETIRQAFYDALNETDNEIAGGALLALRYLCTEYPNEFDTTLISRRAAEIALDDNVNNLTRLSAIQVATMLNNVEIEPAIRALAENTSISLPLRLSAIAGLGHLKCPESRPVLEKLAYGKGPEGKAARTALQKYQTF